MSTNQTDNNANGGRSTGSNNNTRHQNQNRRNNDDYRRPANNRNNQHHSQNSTRTNRPHQKKSQEKQEQEHQEEDKQQQQQQEQQDGKMSFDKSSRRQLLSVSSTSGVAGVTCICCLHDLHTYAFYPCSHFVCLNCAIKMRVLCQKFDCPVCRQQSSTILCTKTDSIDMKNFDTILKKSFKSHPLWLTDTLPSCANILPADSVDPKKKDAVDFGIYFDDKRIMDEYYELIDNKCTICQAEFDKFDELDAHLRRNHKRYYCELCLEYLRLFPYERKYYNREELATHKRIGDKDDFSFKGHPLCGYCDQRFFDRDELYRHCRRDHYYCHFCDSDGIEEYYNDYAQLRQHFLKYHFLCELDDCSKNGAQTHEYVVFRSDIDFQAHKKEKHAKSKSDSKNFSKLNIEFSINDSARNRANNYGSSGGGGGGGGGGGNRNHGNGNKSSRPNNRHAAAAAYDDISDEESSVRYKRNNPSKSKIETTDLNADIIRMSREQSERDEANRSKQRHIQRMREQYDSYEQTLASTFPSVSAATTTATTTTEAAAAAVDNGVTSSKEKPVEKEETKPTATPNNTWSIMMGSGGITPKINNQADFPSLSHVASAPSSLAALGATIASKLASKPFDTVVEPKKKPSPKASTKSNKPAAVSNKKPESDDDDEGLQFRKKSTEPKKLVDEKRNVEKVIAKTESIKLDEKHPPLPPPPGFASNMPPPGFSSLPAPSAPQPPPPPPPIAVEAKATSEAESNFIKPIDYESRNNELTKKLFRLFGGHFNENEFNEFKLKSTEFRTGKLNAKEYMKKCHQLLDLPLSSQSYTSKMNGTVELNNLHLKFLELIQEMIVLLPDAKKQNELFKSFESSWDSYKNRIESQQSAKESGKSAWLAAESKDVDKKIGKCQFCEQYFQNEELKEHQMLHHAKEYKRLEPPQTAAAASRPVAVKMDEEFPSLMSVAPKNPLNWASTQSKPVSASEPVKQVRQVKAAAKEDEFPALGGSLISNNGDVRYGALPTPSLFSNPSSHLSLVNKKKHRLQK